MKSTICLVVFGLYLITWCGGKHKRPHIIFILADDYGFNDVGYHGSEIKTPNIDQLSEYGVRLENYYVQPMCTPTRSQLLSGRYQIHTGLQHSIILPAQPNCHPLEDKMLPEALKEIGYVTHMVGKWHLGLYRKACWPTRRGFDTFFGFLTGGEDHYTHEHTGCGVADLNCTKWIGHDLRRNEEVTYEYRDLYDTHMYTERVQDVLHNHDQNKPLFIYLPYQAVHEPLEVPDSYRNQYDFIKNMDRRVYAGMVTAMDESIGNITDTLRELGMWDDTVLIFSTDNGGHVDYGGNNWPLRGWKRSLWEGGIRGVGFITSPHLPYQIRGTVYKGLMHVSDWFPTIVQGLAGSSVDGLQLDGYNMVEAIRSGCSSPRRELLHNIDPLWPLPESDPLQPPWLLHEKDEVLSSQQDSTRHNVFNTSIRAAIRFGDWKLITGDPGDGHWVPLPDSGITPPEPHDPPGKRLWLFNIAENPNEYSDLSEFHPDIVYKLLRRLQVYYDTAVPVKYPHGDLRANPALYGDVWTHWQD